MRCRNAPLTNAPRGGYRQNAKSASNSKARRRKRSADRFFTGRAKLGTKLKREIVRRAAEQPERIYRAIVNQQQSNKNCEPAESNFRREDVVFAPTRPVQTDWETVSAKVAKKLRT